MRPPGWLESLVASGEYRRIAAECANDIELAARLGTTENSLRKARKRLNLRGIETPTVQELRHTGEIKTFTSADRLPEAWESLGNAYTDIGNADDFEDEEATQPNIVIAEGTQPRIWQPSDFRNPDVVPYEPPPAPLTRKLTRAECPDGTKILWASDVHIPIQNDPVCRLMVGCAERIGVTRVVAGGDILDFNCLSKHAKESRRTVEHATILEEVEPGRWILDWLATKQTDYILGNHEDRLKRFVDENPAFHGSVASNFANVVNLPSNINVIPQGGEVRIGSLSLRHLDAEFKNGTGGKYPANRILEMLPDQSTGGGHVHRIHQARRTTRDEHGISRTHAAWTFGHLSWEHMHYGYVSTSPNWQTGFAVITIEWEDDRPRFDVTPVEVLFNRYNRPYFFLWGEVYR